MFKICILLLFENIVAFGFNPWCAIEIPSSIQRPKSRLQGRCCCSRFVKQRYFSINRKANRLEKQRGKEINSDLGEMCSEFRSEHWTICEKYSAAKSWTVWQKILQDRFLSFYSCHCCLSKAFSKFFRSSDFSARLFSCSSRFFGKLWSKNRFLSLFAPFIRT